MATHYVMLLDPDSLRATGAAWSATVRPYLATTVIYATPPTFAADGTLQAPGVLVSPLPDPDLPPVQITGSLEGQADLGIRGAVAQAQQEIQDAHLQAQALPILRQLVAAYGTSGVPVAVRDLGE